jgi:hypothetical protein
MVEETLKDFFTPIRFAGDISLVAAELPTPQSGCR